jgi:fructokinase
MFNWKINMAAPTSIVKSKVLFAGIEAGGTKFNCVIGTGPNDIRARARIPTTTPDETLAKVQDFFQQGRKEYGAFNALGLACFGPLDLNRASRTYGHIMTTVKQYWSNTNIVGLLSQMFDVPIGFDTDVNGAALGEYRYGAVKNSDNFVYVTVGTGIGAGVLVDGKLIGGSSSMGAGHPEVGHMLVPKYVALDTDSYKGCCPFHSNCIEGFASGTAIQFRWGKTGSELPEDHPAWDIEARYLAAMCVNLTMCYSPEKIILGGGVMEQSHLFEKINKHFLVLIGNFFQELSADKVSNYIVPTSLDGMSGEYGALVLAKNAFDESALKK